MMEIFTYIGVACVAIAGLSLAVGFAACFFFGAMILWNYRK